GPLEALRYVLRRLLSYLFAPLFPLVVVFGLIVFLAFFGLFGEIPILGELFEGVLWIFPLAFGFLIALILVGLVCCWPLMAATISTEGTDSWEAVGRAYNYAITRPWNYAWYAVVAIAYGAVLMFFVGFLASLSVYLAKWGVTQAPLNEYFEREPHYLFVYAPTSFGWRELLLEGARTKANEDGEGGGEDLVNLRAARAAAAGGGAGGVNRWDRIDPAAYQKYTRSPS